MQVRRKCNHIDLHIFREISITDQKQKKWQSASLGLKSEETVRFVLKPPGKLNKPNLIPFPCKTWKVVSVGREKGELPTLLQTFIQCNSQVYEIPGNREDKPDCPSEGIILDISEGAWILDASNWIKNAQNF